MIPIATLKLLFQYKISFNSAQPALENLKKALINAGISINLMGNSAILGRLSAALGYDT